MSSVLQHKVDPFSVSYIECRNLICHEHCTSCGKRKTCKRREITATALRINLSYPVIHYLILLHSRARLTSIFFPGVFHHSYAFVHI